MAKNIIVIGSGSPGHNNVRLVETAIIQSPFEWPNELITCDRWGIPEAVQELARIWGLNIKVMAMKPKVYGSSLASVIMSLELIYHGDQLLSIHGESIPKYVNRTIQMALDKKMPTWIHLI